METLQLSNAQLKHCAVHVIGNKANGEQLILSEQEVALSTEISVRLRDYFSSKFTKVYDRYHFAHPVSLEYNEVFNFCGEIFTEYTPFHDVSCNIAKHLFEQSQHPMIKSGELFVCLFDNVLYEQRYIKAIGIFKTEQKAGFLETSAEGRDLQVQYKEGVDLQKMDKGCLIFHTDFEAGLEMAIIDQVNRGEEAQYWKEDFLKAQKLDTVYHQTTQLLQLTKNYVTQQLSEDVPYSKTEQLDLLSRSAEYFKSKETFNKSEFEQTVLKDADVIESFREYENQYSEINEVNLPEQFALSEQAVKRQSKIFKSILKLDKNFHVYIHGDRNMIEQGVDEQGRKYYKLYYDQEQ